MRIWIPSGSETAVGLAEAACCASSIDDVVAAIGLPDIEDGGNLVHGNLQVAPQTGHPENSGACPLP